MDKEEARFILRCFRPDGADAANPDFAEALQLAAADRELGEWLAKERAEDAAFAEMLGKLSLPQDLREEIMAGLAAERGDHPQADEIDASLIGALATIRPPDGLRDGILSAMRQSTPEEAPPGTVSMPKKESGSWWRFGLPLAAAAGIALAFLATRNQGGSGSGSEIGQVVPGGKAVPVSFVQQSAIRTLESPDFSLDLKNPDQKALFEFIRDADRACASGCVPEGLVQVDGLGCRVIEIDDKPGAIICFERAENEIVHLVVFRRDDVDGKLPGGASPQFEQHGEWAAARWSEDGRVFVLLGQTDTEDLSELF
ncbi:MAG: hypothetical protein AAGI48_05190 [Verrucomicrobiota bacterium]